MKNINFQSFIHSFIYSFIHFIFNDISVHVAAKYITHVQSVHPDKTLKRVVLTRYLKLRNDHVRYEKRKEKRTVTQKSAC